MSAARPGRFDAGVYGALVAGVAGLVLGSTTTFLVAAVALVFVAYGRWSTVPGGSVRVERTVTDASPRPGQAVDVALAVTNVGETVLPDVRVADGVPEGLPVVEGSTAACTSLRPGEEATVEYTVSARRGTATFGDPTVVLRNASGAGERSPDVRAETTLRCRTLVEEVDLAPQTIPYTGQVETDAGGEGIEFHSTRAYQPGDPPSRIDWNRYAERNELTTVRFRETHAATVLVVIETGRSTEAARRRGEPTAQALSEYAAGKLADALLDDHNQVGVARHGPSGWYLAPGGGHEQSVRVRRFIANDGVSGDLIRRNVLDGLRKRLPADAQVVYCSPFLADEPAMFVERLAAYGHPVTVMSPDVTTGETAGGTLARVERAARLDAVRGPEVRIVDWSPDDPLDAALERAAHGWSQ